MKYRTEHRTVLHWVLAIMVITAPSIGRAFYNPEQGRWLSRDPVGESTNVIVAQTDKRLPLGFSELVLEGPNLYCLVANEPASKVDVLGLLCAPKFWRHGCIEFVGCTASQLADFRVIPEKSTGTMTTPGNGWNCDADGFWHKSNSNWYKVPGNCYATVKCSALSFSFDCCCNGCLEIGRRVLGKAPCGLQPNSGETSIAPHNYPF